MSLTTIRYDREQLERAVRSVEARFPEIERIIYTVGEDWANYPAIFIRILLKDSPTTRGVPHDKLEVQRLGALASSIKEALRSDIHTDDLQPYFYFRSVSEQEELRDPKWD